MRGLIALISLFASVAISDVCQAQNCRFSVGLAGSVDFYKHDQERYWRYTASSKLNSSLGIGLYAQLGRRLIVKTGILYSDKGYTLTYTPGKGEYLIDADFYPLPETVIVKLDYLDIPVLAGIRILKAGRFTLVPAAGIVNSFRLERVQEGTYFDGSKKTYRDPENEYHASALFELGLNYRLTEKLQIGLAPYYRTSIEVDDIDLDSPIPKSFGTSADVRYCF